MKNERGKTDSHSLLRTPILRWLNLPRHPKTNKTQGQTINYLTAFSLPEQIEMLNAR